VVRTPRGGRRPRRNTASAARCARPRGNAEEQDYSWRDAPRGSLRVTAAVRNGPAADRYAAFFTLDLGFGAGLRLPWPPGLPLPDFASRSSIASSSVMVRSPLVGQWSAFHLAMLHVAPVAPEYSATDWLSDGMLAEHLEGAACD
jgi:hypothetical protein